MNKLNTQKLSINDNWCENKINELYDKVNESEKNLNIIDSYKEKLNSNDFKRKSYMKTKIHRIKFALFLFIFFNKSYFPLNKFLINFLYNNIS